MITNDRSGVLLANPLCAYRGNVDGPGIATLPVVASVPGVYLIDVSGNRLLSTKSQQLKAVDPITGAFIVATGITNGPTIKAIDILVNGLKTDTVFSRFDALYLFLGSSAGAAKVNLIKPGTFDITWHGSMVFGSGGVTGNGSNAYGDTGFNPNTGIPNYALAKASVFFMTSSFSADAGCTVGANNSTDEVLKIYDATGPHGRPLNQSNTAFGQALGVYNPGFYGISRTNSTTETFFWPVVNPAGISHAGEDAADKIPTNNIYVLARNNGGTPDQFSGSTLSILGFGDGFSTAEMGKIQTRLATFNAALPIPR